MNVIFPEEVKEKLKVTSTKIQPNLSMSEIDRVVKESQENNSDIYEIITICWLIYNQII